MIAVYTTDLFRTFQEDYKFERFDSIVTHSYRRAFSKSPFLTFAVREDNLNENHNGYQGGFFQGRKNLLLVGEGCGHANPCC